MDTTYADLREGERLDIEVELVSRRAVDCGGERVHRLLVTDRAGERFAVLVSPGSDSLVDGMVGATYRVSALLGAEPVDTDDEDAPSGACPVCGGRLRRGRVVDAVDAAVAQSVTKLGLDATFGVVDDRTVLRRVDGDRGVVDDWDPMGLAATDVPASVCTECGRALDAPGAGGGDTGSGAADPGPGGDTRTGERGWPPATGTAGAGATAVRLRGERPGGRPSFRAALAAGRVPWPEDVSDAALFGEYDFERAETGGRVASAAPFAPRYRTAASDHPVTGDAERYLAINLDARPSASGFERPRLDLVVALDVSESMAEPVGESRNGDSGADGGAGSDAATRLEAATRTLCSLTGGLRGGDRLGVVLYNDRTHVAKPLRDVGATDVEAFCRHVRTVDATGSTNHADGLAAATDLLDEAVDPTAERRVVVVTDEASNAASGRRRRFTRVAEDAAVDGVHTTLVGVGGGASGALADSLAGVRGATAVAVDSAASAERVAVEGFPSLVAPMAFDVAFEVLSEGYRVASVHGLPSPTRANDRLVYLGTLFPAPESRGASGGGLVLVRLERTDPEADLELLASWTDRDGAERLERVSVGEFDDPEAFPDGGVRKAVALARYGRELRTWAEEVDRAVESGIDGRDPAPADRRAQASERGRPARLVRPSDLSDPRATRLERLREYLDAERAAVGDDSLRREVDLLSALCRRARERVPQA